VLGKLSSVSLNLLLPYVVLRYENKYLATQTDASVVSVGVSLCVCVSVCVCAHSPSLKLELFMPIFYATPYAHF